MDHKKKFKLYLIFILLLITVLISYKIFLVVYETDYQALNVENLDLIEAEFDGKTRECSLRRSGRQIPSAVPWPQETGHPLLADRRS